MTSDTDCRVHDVGFSPDGRQVVSAVGLPYFLVNYPPNAHRTVPGRAVVHDAVNGRKAYTLDGPSGAVWSAAYSPDGRRLAVAGFDCPVRLLDAESGQEALTLPTLGRRGDGQYNFTPRAVFSPDGRRLAANNWQSTVTIWDSGR